MQDDAWRARARMLAEQSGMSNAAIWRHAASLAGDDYTHTLVVPSGRYDFRTYEVAATERLDYDAHRPRFTFACTCDGHGWGAPCKHVGAAQHSLDMRDAALREAEREAERGTAARSVFGSWLNGGTW